MQTVNCPNCQAPHDVDHIDNDTEWICRSCGMRVHVQNNTPDEPSCESTAAAPQVQPTAPAGEGPIDTTGGLILAIISCLCCCQILGIVAIVYTAQSISMNNAGQYEKARRLARIGRLWAIWAIVIGVLINSIVFLSQLILPFIYVSESSTVLESDSDSPVIIAPMQSDSPVEANR